MAHPDTTAKRDGRIGGLEEWISAGGDPTGWPSDTGDALVTAMMVAMLVDCVSGFVQSRVGESSRCCSFTTLNSGRKQALPSGTKLNPREPGRSGLMRPHRAPAGNETGERDVACSRSNVTVWPLH